MSLVSYDYSDDDDGSSPEESSEPQIEVKGGKLNGDPKPTEEPKVEDKLNSKKPFLPEISIGIDKSSIKRTKSGRIQIAVPSLDIVNQNDSEDDSDSEERRQKRLRKSNKGSSLIALLPKPKNSASPKPTSSSKKSSLTSLVPNSVANRNKAAEKVATISSNSKEETLKTSNFFFNILDDDDDDLDVEIPFEKTMKPEDPIGGDQVYGPAKPDQSFYEQAETAAPTSNQFTLDPNSDTTYKKYIASKFGEESAEQISIVDVDISKHLSKNQDWLKNLSVEKPLTDEELGQSAPNSTARRKHHISFLAYQAKKREVDLKNQWAQNRITKSQTKSKYGF